MGRVGRKYKNPETGKEMSAREWSDHIGISQTQFDRRVKLHGLSKKTFAKKQATVYGHEKWQQWEDDFLSECYGTKLWTAERIARKLERTPTSIINRARTLEIKSAQARKPALNWLYIWNMHREGLSNAAIARIMLSNGSSVRYALNKMNAMDEQGRNDFFESCGYFD